MALGLVCTLLVVCVWVVALCMLGFNFNLCARVSFVVITTLLVCILVMGYLWGAFSFVLFGVLVWVLGYLVVSVCIMGGCLFGFAA